MKEAKLTIELNGKEYVTHTYKYRKESAVMKRIEYLIEWNKRVIPFFADATFKITL